MSAAPPPPPPPAAAPAATPAAAPASAATTPDKKLINLVRGWPSPHILPAALLRDAANAVLSDPAVFVPALQYGPDPGYQPLRERLAAWLADVYADARADRDPERLCVTGGASQAIACVLQSFTDPAYTRAVWVAAPCYFLACPIFADAGFGGRLRAVPEDEDGIDLGRLEEGMRRLEREGEGEGEDQKKGGPRSRPLYKQPGPDRKCYRHVVYVVPTCANPSGKTMPLARREGLVRLARAHDALVICDDVYDLLQWPVGRAPTVPLPLPAGYPIARLSDIDHRLGPSPHDPPVASSSSSSSPSPSSSSPSEPPQRLVFGHAISNGSFSKLLGPGVRTGWVHGTRAFARGLSQTGSTRSGGAPSQLAAALAAQLLPARLDEHVARTVRPELARRHAIALEAARRFLEPAATVTGNGGGGRGGGGGEGQVRGGYFLWLTLREGGPGAALVAARARAEENLIVGHGEMFEVAGDEGAARFPRNLRLCYSWEDEEDVVEGIRRLGSVLRRLEDEIGRGVVPGGSPQGGGGVAAGIAAGTFK